MSTSTGRTSHPPAGSPWPSNQMVKIELEAAEALACLAHSSAIDDGPFGFCSNSDKSVSRRLKSESPADDSGLHPIESVPRSPDLAKDRVVVVQQHGEKIHNTKPIKPEQDAEVQPIPVGCSTYVPSFGSKSRQNLNEAEKVARRVRRVFANRESARQTICRRKALYEELTRKAADLAWENENLKKKKEVAKKEYDSLKSINESLKAQMTKITQVEIEEIQEDLMLSRTDISTSPSTSYPVYIYNQPSMPFLWSSIIPPSNVVQFKYLNQKIPMPTSNEPSSFPEHENPTGINNVPGTPVYILQCPWIFPVSHAASDIHPHSFELPHNQKDILLNTPSCASTCSKNIAHLENPHVFPHIKMKNKASNSTEPIHANNLHENPLNFLPDADGRYVGPQSRGVVLKPEPLSRVRPVEHEDICLPEITRAPAICPSKKVMDAVSAAEARKRRKDIAKLKNMHCRQFRMTY